MTARNRELLILALAGVVASVAFAGAWFREAAAIDYGWVPWALLLGGIFVIAHVVARLTVPDADPTLLPITALLCAIGLTFVYRLDPEGGRKQLVWVAVGVTAFAAVLLWLRYDYRVLERYKYLFGVSAIVLSSGEHTAAARMRSSRAMSVSRLRSPRTSFCCRSAISARRAPATARSERSARSRSNQPRVVSVTASHAAALSSARARNSSRKNRILATIGVKRVSLS